ncbi:MAG: 4Fe-4S binding protein [Bacteroidales bacterium]|jgi:NAD-dependent dihydropyrimidine dehydrogenase PreA subunit|nr:4Fe-4S binding protein [Bacteroidales bacterium]
MERDIIKIDEEKCNGCGICVPNCHEGALQVIDGKVRLVSELMCDGLGACIGYCPEGAITVERREAEPYDEIAVISEMVKKGSNTVKAHLKHLKDYHEYGYLEEGTTWLELNRAELLFDVDEVLATINGKAERVLSSPAVHLNHGGSCPGSAERIIAPVPSFAAPSTVADAPSHLSHWPVQMHLVNPNAPAYRGADLLLAADCVAFSMGAFHSRYLKGKALAIACPKLDHGTESYIDKLTVMIETARINTITVMMMEVPCCGGLIQMVRTALARASRKVPVKAIIVSIDGKILQDDWI